MIALRNAEERARPIGRAHIILFHLNWAAGTSL